MKTLVLGLLAGWLLIATPAAASLVPDTTSAPIEVTLTGYFQNDFSTPLYTRKGWLFLGPIEQAFEAQIQVTLHLEIYRNTVPVIGDCNPPAYEIWHTETATIDTTICPNEDFPPLPLPTPTDTQGPINLHATIEQKAIPVKIEGLDADGNVLYTRTAWFVVGPIVEWWTQPQVAYTLFSLVRIQRRMRQWGEACNDVQPLILETGTEVDTLCEGYLPAPQPKPTPGPARRQGRP